MRDDKSPGLIILNEKGLLLLNYKNAIFNCVFETLQELIENWLVPDWQINL